MDIEELLDEYKDAFEYIESEYKYAPDDLIDTFGFTVIRDFFKDLENIEDFENVQQEIDYFFTKNNFELTKRRRRD